MKNLYQFRIYFSALFVILALIIAGCQKDSSPTLVTMTPTNITSTTATLGGNITDNGGATVSDCGVEYRKSYLSNPVDVKLTPVISYGTFAINITGLEPNTLYYVQAYATNSNGTSYGDYKTFTTTGTGSGTVTDSDGNQYTTVTIGTQTWMTENLKTTKYNNGDRIIHDTIDSQWGSSADGAYCFYLYEPQMKDYSGCLYNWFAVNDVRGIAPAGWHVPTDADWNTLATYLGGASIAGGKLKEAGDTHWYDPNTGATNETGFTALPGGFLYASLVTFNNAGKYAYWWSATNASSDNGGTWAVDYQSTVLSGYSSTKYNGYSVRCIKNNK